MSERYILEYRSEHGHVPRQLEFKTLEEATYLRDCLAPELPYRLLVVREDPPFWTCPDCHVLAGEYHTGSCLFYQSGVRAGGAAYNKEGTP